MFGVFSVSATFWTYRIRNSGLWIRNKTLQIRNFVMMMLSCCSEKKNIFNPMSGGVYAAGTGPGPGWCGESAKGIGVLVF